MDAQELAKLTTTVLWSAFFVSLLFGLIAQRTHFCTMGAISDVVNMGHWSRAKQWALAVGVAMIGFSVLVYVGWLDPRRTLYASNRWLWLSGLIGGGLFGFGMVLASGCGSKTLVRIGTGNLKSLVVFVVMGVAAFATLKGITAVLRVATVDQVFMAVPEPATLGSLLATASGGALASGMGVALGCLCVLWVLLDREFRSWANLLAGLGVGGCIVAMWCISGYLGYVDEHPLTLDSGFVATVSGRSEAMTFTAPMAYALDWVMLFSDKSKTLTLGVASVCGVVVGAFVMAVFSKEFRWEGFAGTEDLGNHLVGAVLMGIGGVTAMGCTIGQGLSGLSTLSLTSLTAVLGIVGGAVTAFRYQMWRLEHTGL